jgi:hypothetical protein
MLLIRDRLLKLSEKLSVVKARDGPLQLYYPSLHHYMYYLIHTQTVYIKYLHLFYRPFVRRVCVTERKNGEGVRSGEKREKESEGEKERVCVCVCMTTCKATLRVDLQGVLLMLIVLRFKHEQNTL